MQSMLIQDQKIFMYHLLTAETFDSFELVKAQIQTFCTFEIDGSYHKGYLPETEDEVNGRYSAWHLLRPHITDLIRGKRKPHSIRLVFRLSDENLRKVIRQVSPPSLSENDVDGLYVNITYSNSENGEQTTCITGLSLHVFSIDKSLEHAWDDIMTRFLKKSKIPFTIL